MTGGAGPRRGIALHHLVIAIGLALGVALWRLLGADPFTDAIEDRLLDLRFKLRGERTPPAGIVLVAIDEAMVDRFGWMPPPRDRIAEAIDRIVEAEPAVLALDLLFLDATEDDATLGAALSTHPEIVLGTAIANRPGEPTDRHDPILDAALARSAIAVVIGNPPLARASPRLFAPAPAFLRTAPLAHVNIVQSTDGVARRIPLSLWSGDQGYLPALPLEVARRRRGIGRGGVVLRPGRSLTLGGQEIITDRFGAIAIGHYGGVATIPTISMLDILDGKVPAGAFTGRVVFVGATAASLSDFFATPFAADTAGVEILATVAANLIAGDLVIRDARTAAIGLVLVALLAALIFMTARLGSVGAGAAASAAVWLIGGGVLHLAFARAGFWLDATAVLGALTLSSLWCAHQRLRAERRIAIEISRQRANLSRYVSPILAEELAHTAVPSFDRREQEASVLFVDVAGYTAIAENLTPTDAAALLRELHRFFEQCATDENGVIISFEGDGAMIVFGLPRPRREDAACALKCGRALVDGAAGVACSFTMDSPLRLRVSINTGPVTAAVIGGERQAHVTLTGDTVNVASRLQDVAKAHGVSLVASRAVLDAARAGGNAAIAAGFTTLTEQAVRGRTGRIEIFADASGMAN